ncbi:BTB/POZ domain and ankyrin repeat-containing protein NPR1-like isoform X1 [Apium graveolens]|uniref:BTB/POZ domain and ankyrin repeat-containing protein NPR1-like isoform X1 n=1 Tax=Apium graveolens TaxID=4045 RepID=UPI003D796B77
MENLTEPSSSITFTSSSIISNGSTSYTLIESSVSETVSSLQVVSLNKLSASLEQLLLDSPSDYSDAEIVVEDIPVGIHRCILAARSKFFDELFKKNKSGLVEKESKPRYCMSDILPFGNVGYEAFLIILSYLYTGKLKPSPPEVSSCVDDGCAHDACRPAINFSVELMYASTIFEVPELVSLFQRRLFNFVEKALVEDVIPIIFTAFHCQSTQLLNQCVHRVARSDLDSISLEKEFPFEVAKDIKLLRVKSQADKNSMVPDDLLREKSIKRIHKALDSDDVELVKLLLTESDVTLDEANGLHYAAAYCDPKVVSQVLSLNLADVNLRNARGYTVLHIAALRKEPSIIVPLLSRGSCALETTLDGRSAVSICKRLTRPKDFHAKTEQGQNSNKDRLCINVLEQEVHRYPMAGNLSRSTSTITDDLHFTLLSLENRVAFARLLFPYEAKLAMEIARADTTSEFSGILASKGSSGNLREVDLNETPIAQNKRLLSRMEALSKTVETGRHYFPHCSEILDKFMVDDLPDSFYLEKGSADEQEARRNRFIELKEDVQKAFTKDKAELERAGLGSSISSPSIKKRRRSQS